MNDIDPAYERLHARYAASLDDKRRALVQAWQAFEQMPSMATCKALGEQVHRLRGSAPAYGYERLGVLAGAVDRLIDGWQSAPSASRPAIASLADDLVVPIQRVLDALTAHADSGMPPASAQPDSALRIVLVEDDSSQAELIAAELAMRGCEVRIESDAQTLTRTLQEWSCHAVVLDFWLRGETAAEVAAMLRREALFARIALLCFSVESDPEVLRAALDAGCDAALAKNEGTGRLLALVRECVARADRSGTAPV